MIEDEIAVCETYNIPYFTIPASLTMRSDPLTEDDLQYIIEREKTNGRSMRIVNTLEGYRLLPRNPRGCTQLILEKVRKYGGTSEISAEGLTHIEHWPKYVDARWTQRKVKVIRAAKIREEAGKYAVQERVFAKLVHNQRGAGHGIIMPINELLKAEENGLPYEGRNLLGESMKQSLTLSKTAIIIISQPINLSSDSYGTLEYRAWIMNSEVIGCARYGKPRQTNVPEDMQAWARVFAEHHRARMPLHYVADIGRTTDRGLALIEMNPTTEAGDTTKELFKKIVEAYRKS